LTAQERPLAARPPSACRLPNKLLLGISSGLRNPNGLWSTIAADKAREEAHDEVKVAADKVTETLRNEPDLTLPYLWDYTHKQLAWYHRIAISQARSSFYTAQVASGAGFGILVYLAFLAANTKTTTGAITAGAFGAVSAALAGYISRTLVASQKSTAKHLHSYFHQPLEFSRYLVVERLLANNRDRDPNKRAAIIGGIVQAVVAPDQASNLEQDKDQEPLGI